MPRHKTGKTRSGGSGPSTEEPRSRTFTGCRTCRSRHLKCDEARPICSSCRRLNLPCEGYTPKLLWVSEQQAATGNGSSVSDESRQSHRGSSYRYLLFTEEARSCMSLELTQSLGQSSAGKALLDLDEEAVQNRDSHSIGPFGVFRAFDRLSPCSSRASPPSGQQDNLEVSVPPICDAPVVDSIVDGDLIQDDIEELPNRSWIGQFDQDVIDPALFSESHFGFSTPSLLDSLTHDWMGIGGSGVEHLQMLSSDTAGMNFLFSPPRSPQLSGLGTQQGHGQDQAKDVEAFHPPVAEKDDSSLSRVPSRMVPLSPSPCSSAESILPPHAASLLRYYKEHVLESNLFSKGMRISPWKILALPCALETFAELSIWNTTSHSRLSILFTILSKSAFHLNQANKSNSDVSNNWLQLAHGYQKAAHEHLKSALKEEVGPLIELASLEERDGSSMTLEKYIEVLMAILSLSVISVSLHGSRIVKAFLMDAERLIRLHGLGTRKSFKKRVLHHTYTHLRIIAESTDVSIDMESPSLPALRSWEQSAQSAIVPRRFHVTKDCLGSDLDLKREKPEHVGYSDIHLEVSGHWSETLYPAIYGIPESLLTLLAQTISIANEKAKLEAMAVTDNSISLALSRHIRTLEQNIWQWSPDHKELPVGPSRPQHLVTDETPLVDQPHTKLIILAMHQALIIYFYRRVYNMSAMVVQDSVRKTLEFIQPCLEGDSYDHDFATTIGWCSFVAACEATSPQLQETSLKCLQAVDDRARLFGADEPCEVVKAVWKHREETGDWAFSWTDVMRQQLI